MNCEGVKPGHRLSPSCEIPWELDDYFFWGMRKRENGKKLFSASEYPKCFYRPSGLKLLILKSDAWTHILAPVIPDRVSSTHYQEKFLDVEINKAYIKCQRTIFGIQRKSQSKWNNSDFYIMLKHLFFFVCYITYFHCYLVIARHW